MNDTEMVDWIQGHLYMLREAGPENYKYTMDWIDDSGHDKTTFGISLRDCVRCAIAGQQSNEPSSPAAEGSPRGARG